MSTEAWRRAAELGLGAMQNPRLLQQLQNIPGATADRIGEALSSFANAAKAGMFGFDIQKKALLPGAPAARPIRTTAEQTQQLPLPLKTRTGRPVTGSVPRPTPRNAETIRLARQASAADVSAAERAYRSVRPSVAPGQRDLFSAPEPQFSVTPRELPSSEAAKALYAQDPGTYKAIQQLADRATSYYGRPVTLDELVGPQGTTILRALEDGPLAATKTQGGGIIPPTVGGGVATRGPGGPLVSAPGGAVGEAFTPERARDFIDAEYRVLGGELANRARAAAGAVPSATTNLSDINAGFPLPRGRGPIAAAVAGGGLLGLTAQQYLANRLGQEGPVDYGTPDYVPDAFEAPVTPDLSGTAGGITPPPVSPGSLLPGTPGGRAAGGVTGQPGSGQVVIATSDRESDYRQARANALAAAARGEGKAPKAPSEYGRIAQYYAEREKFARQPERRAELARQVATMEGAAPRALEWAAANPGLAYELLQKAQSRPDLSQQTPQAQGVTVGTQMGDNTVNNAVGNAQAAGSAAVDRTAGSTDLEDTTRPLIRPVLNRVPLGGRYVPIGGPSAYPTVPFV